MVEPALIGELRSRADRNPGWAAILRMAADEIERLWETNAELRGVVDRLTFYQIQNKELREALERLGSNEAFDVARGFQHPQDDELIARIDYARAALQEGGGDVE